MILNKTINRFFSYSILLCIIFLNACSGEKSNNSSISSSSNDVTSSISLSEDKGCSHAGYHYASNEPTCIHSGNKEFWLCSYCYKVYFEKPSNGIWQDADISSISSFNASHVAYLPIDENAHNFDDKNICSYCYKPLKSTDIIENGLENSIEEKSPSVFHFFKTSYKKEFNVTQSVDLINGGLLTSIKFKDYDLKNVDKLYFCLSYSSNDNNENTNSLTLFSNDADEGVKLSCSDINKSKAIVCLTRYNEYKFRISYKYLGTIEWLECSTKTKNTLLNFSDFKIFANKNDIGTFEGNATLSISDVYVNSDYKFSLSSNLIADYKIKCLNDNATKSGGKLISDTFSDVFGEYYSLTNFEDGEIFDCNEKSIIIGSHSSFTHYSDISQYNFSNDSFLIKTIGNAVFILANDKDGYNLASKKLLNLLFEYDVYGRDTINYETKESLLNELMPSFDLFFTPSIQIRQANWNDYYNFGAELGYNFGIGGNGNSGFIAYNSESTHTLERIFKKDANDVEQDWFATNCNHLCFSCHGNYDDETFANMVNYAAKKIASIFAKSELNDKRFTFGIPDDNKMCNCATCRQFKEERGASYLYMRFMKYLYDAIEKLYDGEFSLYFLAYEQYIEPPKNVVNNYFGDRNVYAFIGDVYADYSSNVAQYEIDRVKAWADICKVALWIYDTNYLDEQLPYMSWEGNASRIKAFAQIDNVKHIFMQGQGSSTDKQFGTKYRTGFESLKLFTNEKLMEDCSQDYNQLVSDYFLGAFNKGSTLIKKFFDELKIRLNIDKSLYGKGFGYDKFYYYNDKYIYQNLVYEKYWDFDEINKWIDYCEDALKLVDNEKYKKNIKAEEIFLLYIMKNCFAENYKSLYSEVQYNENIIDKLNSYYDELKWLNPYA